MIFDPAGNSAHGNRVPDRTAQYDVSDSRRDTRDTSRSSSPQHSPVAYAITGPALLQTEQVLLRRAPEFVPIIQQIRRGGAIAVQSNDPEVGGTFNLYRVSTSQEACKMIADALTRTLDAQRGHPASLRVLVNIWQKLQNQMC